MRSLLRPNKLKKFYSTESKKTVEDIVKLNHKGKVAEALDYYDNLKRSGHNFSLLEYNQIISSFAPKSLMFSWFKNFKDYVDMYYEAGFFKTKERRDEAYNIFTEMKKKGVVPDIVTYNSLMKVFLSTGPSTLTSVFQVYNESVEKVEPNISTYVNLLRACALSENVKLAEEIYGWTIYKFKTKQNDFVGIQLYNAMMDVYAEARNDRIYPFFEQMLQKEIPVDGMTFNILAKAAIFMDQRHKLAFLPELMRVEGVLQKELSKPVRQEIFSAMKKHSHYFKRDDMSVKSMKKEVERRQALLLEFKNTSHVFMNKWGRDEDIHSYHVFNSAKPYLEKYLIDPAKIQKPIYETSFGEENQFLEEIKEFPAEISGPDFPRD